MERSIYLLSRYIRACGKNYPKLQRILDEHMVLFKFARGSLYKHQSWEGGYLQHVVDCMTIARRNMNYTTKPWPIPFKWSSVVLVLFLHDIEKPFMQADYAAHTENWEPWDKATRMDFRKDMIKRYELELTDEEHNALTYIHGEGDDYHPEKRIMNELGALCHAADTLSARLWWNRNKPNT